MDLNVTYLLNKKWKPQELEKKQRKIFRKILTPHKTADGTWREKNEDLYNYSEKITHQCRKKG